MDMQTLQGTTQELADKMGIDYATCRGILVFFIKRGLAKEIGKKTKEGTKGKPSTIYEINSHIELDLP